VNSESNLHVIAQAAGPSAQVISLAELHPEAGHESAASVVAHANPLLSVRARVEVSVGQIELTVGELLAAKERQVLALQRAVHDPVDLMLEGKVVARGQLVAVNGHFGVLITELPIPLKV
jgi:flagellar motor switch protein FliN